MFIETVLQYVEEGPVGGPVLPGVGHDEAVARAVNLIHSEPAGPWTIQSLAAAVSVSRSVLAERFTREIGRPPSSTSPDGGSSWPPGS